MPLELGAATLRTALFSLQSDFPNCSNSYAAINNVKRLLTLYLFLNHTSASALNLFKLSFFKTFSLMHRTGLATQVKVIIVSSLAEGIYSMGK